MADSAVAITAGSGTNVDTRTEGTNSNHRQVIVIGDPATNAGVAPVDVTAGLKVDLGADNDVTITGAALTALQLIDDAIYAEDVASAGADKGIAVLAVRQNTPANSSGTDGDYEPFKIKGGRLHVASRADYGDAYETVAASQTAQVLGASGATGDYIKHLIIVPATTAPGNVLLLDNATSITIFTGGTGSITSLQPFHVLLDMVSVSGAWKVTTGSNVSVIAVGKFS